MYKAGLVVLFGAFASLPALNPAQAAVGSYGSALAEHSSVVPVHYSQRYGWHCGMWERYGHSHKEICWRMRHGGYWGGGGGRRHHWDDKNGKRDHDGDKDRDHDGGKGDRNGGDRNGGDRDGGDKY
jgi:hypothetical protein